MYICLHIRLCHPLFRYLKQSLFFSHNLNDTKPCLTCRTQKVKQDVEKAKYQNNSNNKWAEHYIHWTLSLIYSLYCSPNSVTFFSTSILFSSLYLHTYTPAISPAERQNDISLKSTAVFLDLIRIITAFQLVIIESFAQMTSLDIHGLINKRHTLWETRWNAISSFWRQKVHPPLRFNITEMWTGINEEGIWSNFVPLSQNVLSYFWTMHNIF